MSGLLRQLEEQLTNDVDLTYIEELSIGQKRLEKAWEVYDHEHLVQNVPAGEELYHMGKYIDFAIEDFQEVLMILDDYLRDWPEDPVELAEEIQQQEEFYSNLNLK